MYTCATNRSKRLLPEYTPSQRSKDERREWRRKVEGAERGVVAWPQLGFPVLLVLEGISTKPLVALGSPSWACQHLTPVIEVHTLSCGDAPVGVFNSHCAQNPVHSMWHHWFKYTVDT